MDDEGERRLQYIPVDKLFPHPDNPRKELGDLTELAESIKVKGVMQNLTYEYLQTIGYEMSDEEKALMDGTHELYLKEDANG
ncbi:MAG: ParB N-terminal domain-containing protein [Clostridia bacterium]|nr:ParB N-terminal domain-containing protein [Clostridia bacterium]